MGEMRPLSREEVGAVQLLWTLHKLLEENPDLELEIPTGDIIKTTPRELATQIAKLAGIGSGTSITNDLIPRVEKLEKQVKVIDEEIGGINDALDDLENKSAKKPATDNKTEARPKPPV